MTILEAVPAGRAGPSGPTTIRLSGEIDILTGKALRMQLLDALRSCTNTLILDLSGVTFCDASGLTILIGIQHRARALGIVLTLARPRPYMSRLLHITGLNRSFAMAT